MCKLSYTLCGHFSGEACGCKNFVKKPEYCAAAEKTFTKGTFFKKPAGRPAWTPILLIPEDGVGHYDLMYGGVKYQTEKCFHPVDCKNIECVEQDTTNYCPFHSDHEIRLDIFHHTTHLKMDENSKKERLARMNGETPAMRKVKRVLRDIIA